MKVLLSILLLSNCVLLSAQFSIPEYRIVQDSGTHITVYHSGNSEKIKLSYSHVDTLSIIMPDIKLRNGIVDHKGLTGEMYVREYYVDSMIIGYLEYDGHDIQREIYFNPKGDVFLEKRYNDHSSRLMK